MHYDFESIETRWQRTWEEEGTFVTPNPGAPGFDPQRPKFYVLDMFPYPSGAGLHVGHPLGYIATDIVARYKRMRGFHVLHPMGYDAFGLPAEQYAIEHGVHPRTVTEENIENMRRQLKRLGLSYDWSRELATTDPAYYKWTQWIFLQLYKSWFDPARHAARPIGELEQALASERYYVGPGGELVENPAEGLDAVGGTPIGARKWHELSPGERAEVLDAHRLAYLDEVPVNWCPALGTVLANEEVTAEGRSERGNHPVYARPLRQWMLRITAYADRLLEELEAVAWPESIKAMQRNWIGKSHGARIDFPVADDPDGEVITTFTTRPDTLFGATYMALAPEHPMVDTLTTPGQAKAVADYRREAAARSSLDRRAEERPKTGVDTGRAAVNPATGERLPIWVADYVLTDYGTGAIMAVPAHDERDFAFARAMGLPVRPVVRAPEKHDFEKAAWTGEGTLENSASDALTLDGLASEEAKRRMIAWLEAEGRGAGRVQYKLRDWLFSRQRYWGEPFPILHAPDGRIRPVSEDELPVTLPEMDRFQPEVDEADSAEAPQETVPEPPLARAPESWQYVEKDGVRWRRELNTMPQWAGSCWYYLRFLDPRHAERFVGREAEAYWMHALKPDGTPHAGGVDLYVGGVEHAVLHLLYARFWHKVLYDLGHVSTPEPFGRLFNQGYIQAYYYERANGTRVPAEAVVNRDGRPASEVQGAPGERFYYEGEEVFERYGKMGKSLKNVVNPDAMCREYGCDSLRLYEMYLGPLEQSKPWRTDDVVGVHRFLQRVWRNFVDEASGRLLVSDAPPEPELRRRLHRTIERVSGDMERLGFNTAIAALIELNNALVARETIPRELASAFVRMLAPLAPHIAEELWHRLGHAETVAFAPWPETDPAALESETTELPVQVNGKVRGRIEVPADAGEAAIREAALAHEKVSPHAGAVQKVIVVPGRLVNVVLEKG